jgi:hypothetical protein
MPGDGGNRENLGRKATGSFFPAEMLKTASADQATASSFTGVSGKRQLSSRGFRLIYVGRKCKESHNTIHKAIF